LIPRKDIIRLIDWQKQLSKLEEEVNNLEMKKLENIPRTKSFQDLIENHEEGGQMTPDKIANGTVTPKNIDKYVRKFLEKYAEEMKKVNTPLSNVLAIEAQECRKDLDSCKASRSSEEAHELKKLIAHSICSKFSSKAKLDQSHVHPTSSKPPVEESKVLGFNDLLRAIHEISKVQFKELDSSIQDPSAKFNLLKLRRNTLMHLGTENYKDKESDLLFINSVESNKESVEMLMKYIAKDCLPPRTVSSEKPSKPSLDHSDSSDDFQVNFISLHKDEIGKRESENPRPREQSNPRPTLVDSDLVSGSDYNFRQSDDSRGGFMNIQNKIDMMEANIIDSDEENSSIASEKEGPVTRVISTYVIDYREDLADALDQIIDNINTCIGDIKLAREILKNHKKSRTLSDHKKLEILDKVGKLIEECNNLSKQGDRFKAPYEELKNTILDLENNDGHILPAIHNKGLIKMWGKYKRYAKKLKAENVAFIDEIQASEFMKYQNNKDREEELENIKNTLEEIQAAIAFENAQEEKETFHKEQEPIQSKRLSVYEIQKLVEEDTKKQKEMDKKSKC
jgi:hypothetical protein